MVYTIDPEFDVEIKDKVKEYCPVESVAWTINSNSSQRDITIQNGAISTAWVGEGVNRTESTNPSFDRIEVKNYTLTSEIYVTNELLEDNDQMLYQFLMRDISMEFARAKGLAYMLGDGATQPRGILNTTNTNTTIATGATTDSTGTSAFKIKYTDLIEAMHSLNPFYTMRGVWFMNNKTLGEVSALTDSDGRLIVRRDGNIIGPLGMTLLGRPIIVCQGMDDTGTTGKFPIVYGDPMEYLILNRSQVSFLIDPYTQAASNSLKILAKLRTGGSIVRKEAFCKIAT